MLIHLTLLTGLSIPAAWAAESRTRKRDHLGKCTVHPGNPWAAGLAQEGGAVSVPTCPLRGTARAGSPSLPLPPLVLAPEPG